MNFSYLALLSNNLFWSIVVRTMIGGNLSSKSNDRSSATAQQFSKIFVVTILFIFSSLIYPLRLLVIARFISFRPQFVAKRIVVSSNVDLNSNFGHINRSISSLSFIEFLPQNSVLKQQFYDCLFDFCHQLCCLPPN